MLENWQQLVSKQNIFCFKRKSGPSATKIKVDNDLSGMMAADLINTI